MLKSKRCDKHKTTTVGQCPAVYHSKIYLKASTGLIIKGFSQFNSCENSPKHTLLEEGKGINVNDGGILVLILHKLLKNVSKWDPINGIDAAIKIG